MDVLKFCALNSNSAVSLSCSHGQATPAVHAHPDHSLTKAALCDLIPEKTRSQGRQRGKHCPGDEAASAQSSREWELLMFAEKGMEESLQKPGELSL
jgi:hypothetical protein